MRPCWAAGLRWCFLEDSVTPPGHALEGFIRVGLLWSASLWAGRAAVVLPGGLGKSPKQALQKSMPSLGCIPIGLQRCNGGTGALHAAPKWPTCLWAGRAAMGLPGGLSKSPRQALGSSRRACLPGGRLPVERSGCDGGAGALPDARYGSWGESYSLRPAFSGNRPLPR